MKGPVPRVAADWTVEGELHEGWSLRMTELQRPKTVDLAWASALLVTATLFFTLLTGSVLAVMLWVMLFAAGLGHYSERRDAGSTRPTTLHVRRSGVELEDRTWTARQVLGAYWKRRTTGTTLMLVLDDGTREAVFTVAGRMDGPEAHQLLDCIVRVAQLNHGRPDEVPTQLRRLQLAQRTG